jgi:hypothetical protein
MFWVTVDSDSRFYVLILITDLAGSENAADAQFHDRSLVKETQLINKSLMALKDCIRNRALSALNPDRYYHIPYRLSKLTLLLKVRHQSFSITPKDVPLQVRRI